MPRKQKEYGVVVVALPDTTRFTALIEVPEVNALPPPFQHSVVSLEKGMVIVVAEVACGSM